MESAKIEEKVKALTAIVESLKARVKFLEDELLIDEDDEDGDECDGD